tara:strand:+ start:1043 stop:1264 length:222 start_codon:yes stop_codon:yes gene_type:complete
MILRKVEKDVSTWTIHKSQIEDWTGWKFSDEDFDTIVTAIDQNDSIYSFFKEGVDAVVELLVEEGSVSVKEEE